MTSQSSAPPPPQIIKHASNRFKLVSFVEFPPLFICKGGRAFRREDSKEAYKLPHRLIEKKRRDRINECIAQLKDLLPEHLKLSTLGHLEKAVVLELTLKHVKTLTSLTQQQQERLNVLQKGEQPELDDQTGLQAFRLGYHACAREVLTYLARQERWGACEASSPGLLSHLQRAVTLGFPDGVASPLSVDPRSCTTAAEEEEEDGSRRGAGGPHCVPVIRRGALGGGAASGGTEAAGSPHPAAADGAGDATRASSNSDTDSDSGYGGDGGARCAGGGGCREGARVKRERVAGHAPDRRSKKRRFKVEPECRADATAARAAPLGGERGAGCASELATNGPNQPFIVPFYLVHPAAAAAAAAAAYGPMVEGKAAHGFAPLLDKMPFPLLYSGLPPALAAAALHNMQQQQQSLSSIGTPSSPASEDDIE
ncbi:unnamed protein product [Lampetra fluviatilis]